MRWRVRSGRSHDRATQDGNSLRTRQGRIYRQLRLAFAFQKRSRTHWVTARNIWPGARTSGVAFPTNKEARVVSLAQVGAIPSSQSLMAFGFLLHVGEVSLMTLKRRIKWSCAYRKCQPENREQFPTRIPLSLDRRSLDLWIGHRKLSSKRKDSDLKKGPPCAS